jgi:uncharacterized protein (TIGR02246 family)
MNPDERKIRELLDAWWHATRTGDADALLDLMTDDVLFLTPGQEPFGKAEFAQAARGRSVEVDGKSEIEELEVMDGWAWMRTRIEVTMRPASGTPQHRAGRTLTILRRDGDGRWRLARDANLLAGEQ